MSIPLIRAMGEIVCSRRFGIDSAHRVLEHESRCKHWHGHRFEIEITCRAEQLDSLGRVIDFGVVKDIFGRWLDDNLDHNSILNERDPVFHVLTQEEQNAIFLGKSPYKMDCNPTSENIAILLYGIANRLLNHLGVYCCHIRVYETPNCWADYHAD